ncbi:MAG: N-acetyl-glucosamine-6-phosphate deacetylase [Caeruleum heppii]|nr:MAG: N-acetyl-glucosamine-6-phosphate deacetylase [Caeruleum heppii]
MSKFVPDIFFPSALTRSFGREFLPNRYHEEAAAKSAQVVDTAIKRTKAILLQQNIVPWKFHPREAPFEPLLNSTRTYVTSIILTQTKCDSRETFRALAGQVDESYRLSISTSGRASVTAPSSIGILRALSTLTQLFFEHSQPGGGIYTNLAPIDIDDNPVFSHRGLNLDVARNWYPPQDIKHVIDTLAWNKFNRLHLHITDSQSWPLEIPALPDLAGKGAYREGLSYSPETIQDIQQHGADQGVQVFLEIDMPGHTTSIGLSHPELITAFNVLPEWEKYALEPPSGQLKLNASTVYSLINTLLDDLLPRLQPFSAYFHTGGDELDVNAYLLDDTVMSNDPAVIRPLLQTFTDHVHRKVRQHGLIPIVWEEMLLHWNLTLGPDVIVQTWRGEEAVHEVMQRGHQVIAGNYQNWYLDCGQGSWLSPRDAASASSSVQPPYLDYCSPVKNWRQIYSYDPLAAPRPALSATSSQPPPLSSFQDRRHHDPRILGAEIHLWSEQTDPVTLDSMLWPRAAAAGEVLWSGATDEEGRKRNLTDASRRLSVWRERMVRRGVQARIVQMLYCTMEGVEACSL